MRTTETDKTSVRTLGGSAKWGLILATLVTVYPHASFAEDSGLNAGFNFRLPTTTEFYSNEPSLLEPLKFKDQPIDPTQPDYTQSRWYQNKKAREEKNKERKIEYDEDGKPIPPKKEESNSSLDQLYFAAHELKSRATPRMDFKLTNDENEVLVGVKAKIEFDNFNVSAPWKSDVAVQFNVVSPVISNNLKLKMEAGSEGAAARLEYKVPFHTLFFDR